MVIKKYKQCGGDFEDCDLKLIDTKNIEIEKKYKIFNTIKFNIKISSIGGILDIRPITHIHYSHIDNSIGNSRMATMHVESKECDSTNYSLCFGFTGAMKIVKYMLKKINSSIKIHKLNININNGIPITKDLTDFHISDNLTILAVSTRRNNNYGHYTLVIFDKGKTFVFDSQNKHPDKHTLKILKTHGLKNIKSVYNLNNKCYNTIPHQSHSSHFCAIWTACLVLLIGINDDVSFLQLFDYFGYKAHDYDYLDKKIKQFAMYLYELDDMFDIT